MADSLHPAATHHLPSFITAPGETDVLMVIMAAILLLAVLGFGILFLRLHTLPERMAHKGHKIQFEIVAVLGLIMAARWIRVYRAVGHPGPSLTREKIVPPERNFPLLVVVAHGALAVTTLVLVLLTAL